MFQRLLLILLLLTIAKDTQAVQYAYEIRFTDKQHTLSIGDAPTFLSRKALDRRTKLGIALDSTDLPVSAAYLDSVLALPGVTLHCVSKWLNLCVVLAEDTIAVKTLTSKPFIKSVIQVAYYPQRLHKPIDAESDAALLLKGTAAATYYSKTWNQTALVQGQYLHSNGYTGQHTLIAVVDAGFLAVNTHPAFDSLMQSGRIVDVHNFTYDTSYVFDYDNHGTRSLSTIAAYVPDTFVGAAPLANYALYVTEDNGSEQPIELLNLLAASERADSAGADIISCSLGYNEFDPPFTSFVFSRDFDGKTTLAAQAANMATAKGILFVTSAGNEGQSAWGRILTPGDADSALTIGSVDITGINAGSSGYGPNAAGRVKPDVCALGHNAAVMNGFSYDEEDGTSFSTPQIAGWAACLAEANPQATPAQLRYAITHCASSYARPGTQIGYGIPDLECSGRYVGITDTLPLAYTDTVVMLENPVKDLFAIKITVASPQTVAFRLTDITGKTVVNLDQALTVGDNFIYYPDADLFPAGMYLLRIRGERIHYSRKLIKW